MFHGALSGSTYLWKGNLQPEGFPTQAASDIITTECDVQFFRVHIEPRTSRFRRGRRARRKNRRVHEHFDFRCELKEDARTRYPRIRFNITVRESVKFELSSCASGHILEDGSTDDMM